MRSYLCLKLILSLLAGAMTKLPADQFGLFTYEVVDGTSVTITDYPESATGAVTVPAEIAGLPVTTLGPVCFSYCTGLTEIILPAGITTIKDAAFAGCTGLGSIILPANLTFIGGAAFESCTGLTAITIPPGVTTLGGDAFHNCGNLASVSLPASLTYIGGLAFAYCGSLTSISLPPGLTFLGSGAFMECVNLTTIELPAGLPVLLDSLFWNCQNLTAVTLPTGIPSIRSGVFRGCQRLASLVIPASVTTIEAEAFQFCQALTGISLPPNLRRIEPDAFYACSSLTEMVIPASVELVSASSFIGCIGITAFTVDPLNPHYSSADGVLFDKEKTSLIACPARKTGEYAIPSTVVEIRKQAFQGCTLLSLISIPAEVTTLGEEVFDVCRGLTGFVVHPLNTALSSVDGVLFDKTQSLLHYYPAQKAGAYRIPDGVTAIGPTAFFGCAALTSLTVPQGVQSIGSYAFGYCTGLTGLSFPSSVTSLGHSAFFGCSGLTTIVLPAGIWLVDQSVFEECTALVRLVFLGPAPRYLYSLPSEAAPGFAIYSLSSMSGYTYPTWKGLPSVQIDVAAYPAAAWLLTHGLWYDTSLNQDPDGDGVPHLMAYALDLDPHLNLRTKLPAPVLEDGRLSLTFHAAAPGIGYTVESSEDLTQWSTAEVTLGPLDAQQRRTASVPGTGAQRFLRLKVAP